MEIKPLADRVLIQPAAAEEVTASGIIIPDSAKEKPLKGKVLAVGNGTKDEEWCSKPVIMFSMASIRVRKSTLTARKCSSCVRTKYSPLFSKNTALT